MGGQGGREGVPGGRRGHGGPLAKKDRPGFLFHRHVRVRGRVGGGDLEGGNEMGVEEGEDSVGDFVNWEVLADIPLGGFPHEGAFRGVELG